MGRTGGDALVELLRTLGVEAAFGVVSVHNLPLIDAVDEHLRFVPTRHEQAAVNAADGYARAAHGLGVAITSTGTGAGHAAGALIESLSAGSPVLHVTGQVESFWLGQRRGALHETKDQLGMLQAVSKRAFQVGVDDDPGDVLAAAVEEAISAPRGPVSVEWPIDLQYRSSSGSSRTSVAPRALPAPDPDAIRAAARLVAAARRPLVWAGGGALDAGTWVAQLLDRTGAGLLTSNAGRGVVREDDGRCIGNFASSPSCEPLLRDADLLVSIGTHFRSNETRSYRLELPRPHVQVDVDPDAVGRVHPADVGLVGDAATALRQLLAELGEITPDPGWAERVRQVREDVRARMVDDIGPHAVISEQMRKLLPDSSVIARDITIPSSTWGNRLLPILEPGTNVYPRGGGIGQGLAMGIGGAVARPGVPSAVIIGDGGLVAQVGELATLAQEQLHLIVVVFNDGGYGVIRNLQDRHMERRFGVDLATPDFPQLARAFALNHRRVSDVADFGDALGAAVENPGPWLLEIDVQAIGEMPRPFTPPVTVPGTEE